MRGRGSPGRRFTMDLAVGYACGQWRGGAWSPVTRRAGRRQPQVNPLCSRTAAQAPALGVTVRASSPCPAAEAPGGHGLTPPSERPAGLGCCSPPQSPVSQTSCAWCQHSRPPEALTGTSMWTAPSRGRPQQTRLLSPARTAAATVAAARSGGHRPWRAGEPEGPARLRLSALNPGRVSTGEFVVKEWGF